MPQHALSFVMSDAGVVSVRVKTPEGVSHKVDVSKEEPLIAVKQQLLSLPVAKQPYSCFSFALDGKPLDVLSTLSEYGITSDVDLDLSLKPYTLAEVKIHLERAQEALGFVTPDVEWSVNLGASVITSLGTTMLNDGEIPESSTTAVAHQNLLGPRPQARFLGFSKYHPPAAAEKFAGILAYLRFESSNKKVSHIVATPSGFKFTRTTDETYDPRPQGDHTEVSLLKLLGLVKVTERLAACVSKNPVLSWAPLGQAAVSARANFRVEVPTPCPKRGPNPLVGERRDWNEDFQSALELPHEEIRDRVTREKLSVGIAAEFARAATEGAVNAIEGNMPPLNPGESRDAWIWLKDNIFYTMGTDFAGAFVHLGGDEAAHLAAAKDLQGAQSIMQLGVDGVSPVLTTIVDYCGRRVVAQGPVPGVFRDSPEQQIKYGSTEGRDQILNDSIFQPPFEEIRKALHLEKHTFAGVELETSVDVKGMLGLDGRKYILDTYRLAPPDLSFEVPRDYPHRLFLLRPEAVVLYAAEHEGLELNPDGWLPEASEADTRKLVEVSKFVQNDLVQRLLNEIKDSLSTNPLDGTQLTQAMHRKGINMRYLGKVQQYAKQFKFLETLVHLCAVEAAARAFKHIAARNVKVYSDLGDIRTKLEHMVLNPPREVIEEAGTRFPGIDVDENILKSSRFVKEVSRLLGLQWNANGNLVAVVPLVSYASPRALVAEEALTASRMTEDPQVSIELAAEGVALMGQVHGPIHPDTARAHNSTALVYHKHGKNKEAAEASTRAVTISERTQGLDSGETIVMYTNLAYFERAAGRPEVGLRLSQYLLSLWQGDHPDKATAYNHGGLMLAQLKKYEESIPWFEESIRMLDYAGQSKSLSAAAVSVELAQSQLLLKDYGRASRTMEKAWSIYKELKGADDEQTKECKGWLDQLLAATVQGAKYNFAKLEKRKPRAKAPEPAARKSDPSAPKVGSASINDVVAYITGGTQSKKKRS